MKRVLLIAALLFAAVAARASGPYYVAATGNDSNPGTLASPFLTLAHAQTVWTAAGTGQTCFIRGGAYYNVTLELQGPQNGVGHDDSGLSLIGYPGDPPAILYGGQPLTGWTASSNGMWVASLGTYPASSLNSSVNEFTSWNVRMLLVDGIMATRAVFPTSGTNLVYTNQSTQPDQTWINYNPGTVPATMIPTNAEVMIDFSWDSETMQVAQITNATRTIKFTAAVGAGFVDSVGLQYIPDIQTYRIYNTVEGMANQGQFYWDKVGNQVFYIPIGGKNPNTSTIIVPTTSRMFYYYGYTDAGGGPFIGADGPSPLTFSNLNLMVNAVDVEPEGPYGFLWDHMSLFNFREIGPGGHQISFLNCFLGNCGGTAIGGDFAFVTNVSVLNSTIANCGGAGVVIRHSPGTIISNDFIHDCGLIAWQSPGVRVSTNSTVIQNDLWNFRVAAIAGQDVDQCNFLLNSISNAMQTEEDFGAYYQYFGSGASPHPHGNRIISNLWQNIGTNFNVSGGDARNFYRPATYLDEQSSNTVVAMNIFINCPTPLFQNIGHSNAWQTNFIYNPNNVVNYDGLRLYSSSDSTLGQLIGTVGYGVSNTVIDNFGAALSGSSPNLIYSTNIGLAQTLPSYVTNQNPLLAQFSEPFIYQGNSPALASNIVPLMFVQATNMHGVQNPNSGNCYWIFPVSMNASASDSNPGTNPCLPWKDMAKLSFGTGVAFNPGDAIYIGGIFDHSGDSGSTSINFPSLTGTSLNPITITNDGFVCISNSGPNVNCMALTGCSWLRVFGINVSNAYRSVQIEQCTNCEFAYMDWGGGNPAIGILQTAIVYSNSQYNWFHDLTVHDNPINPQADGTHGLSIGEAFATNDWTLGNILERITAYHAGHDCISIYGPSNVLISSFVHNENYGWRVDIGGGTITNGVGYPPTPNGGITGTNAAHRCVEIGLTLGYGNLLESNRFQYAGFCPNTPHGLEVDGPGTNIIRNNMLSDNGYSGLTLYGGKVTLQPNLSWGNGVYYNNTIAKNGFGPSTHTNYATNSGSANIWVPGSTQSIAVWLPAVTVANNTNSVFMNNLLWNNFENYINSESGAPFISANNLSSTASGIFTDETDGGAWSTASPSYIPTSSNPGLNAGGWLTYITSSSGSGTTFTVNDSRWFFAGMTAATRTIPGDTMGFRGSSQMAVIASISGNTITVSSPISWTQNQGVATPPPLNANPSIGAGDMVVAPLPPSGFLIIVGGSTGDVWTGSAISPFVATGPTN